MRVWPYQCWGLCGGSRVGALLGGLDLWLQVGRWVKISTRVSCTLVLYEIHTHRNMVVWRVHSYIFCWVSKTTLTSLSSACTPLKFSTYLKTPRNMKSRKVAMFGEMLVIMQPPFPTSYYTRCNKAVVPQSIFDKVSTTAVSETWRMTHKCCSPLGQVASCQWATKSQPGSKRTLCLLPHSPGKFLKIVIWSFDFIYTHTACMTNPCPATIMWSSISCQCAFLQFLVKSSLASSWTNISSLSTFYKPPPLHTQSSCDLNVCLVTYSH